MILLPGPIPSYVLFPPAVIIIMMKMTMVSCDLIINIDIETTGHMLSIYQGN